MRHGYDGDMRYNSFSRRSNEWFEQNLEGNGSCEVEYSTSSFDTSYIIDGIDVWEKPFQGCRVDHRSRIFTTSQNMMTYSSHPSTNVLVICMVMRLEVEEEEH